jgi:hypothetical protein
MDPDPHAASRIAEVTRLREELKRTADYIIARAHGARRLGMTADAHRLNAAGLERQVGRAEILLFHQAVETFRAAAAENRLVADALDVLEGQSGL